MSHHQLFLGAGSAQVSGQAVFTSGTSWVVPAGVTSVSILCIEQGGDASSTGTEVARSGTPLVRAKNGARIGTGGGDGGAGGAATFVPGPDVTIAGGGGGAGGYSGNGGAGRAGNDASTAPSGSGGGGGGGGRAGGRGGGVGLLGTGSAGAGGAAGASGLGGSGGGNGGAVTTTLGGGGLYGGGSASSTFGVNGHAGGANSWANNIAVTPGETLTITIPTGGSDDGAVRIMWGGGRSYPSNAANV